MGRRPLQKVYVLICILQQCCEDFFYGVGDGVCVFFHTGSGVFHGIPNAGIFQHFDVVILVAKCDAFFRCDAEVFGQGLKCGAFVGAGGDEVYPQVAGGDDFNLVSEPLFEVGQQVVGSVEIAGRQFEERLLYAGKIRAVNNVVEKFIAQMTDKCFAGGSV